MEVKHGEFLFLCTLNISVSHVVPVKAMAYHAEEAAASEHQVLWGKVRNNRCENCWSEDNKRSKKARTEMTNDQLLIVNVKTLHFHQLVKVLITPRAFILSVHSIPHTDSLIFSCKGVSDILWGDVGV